MVWTAIGAEVIVLGLLWLVSYLNRKCSKGWLEIVKLIMSALSIISMMVSCVELGRAGWEEAALYCNVVVFLVIFVAILIYGCIDEEGPIEVDPPM